MHAIAVLHYRTCYAIMDDCNEPGYHPGHILSCLAPSEMADTGNSSPVDYIIVPTLSGTVVDFDHAGAMLGRTIRSHGDIRPATSLDGRG